MLYTARRTDRRAHRGTVVDITRTMRSVFAPSAQLLADYKGGRCDWPAYEGRYRAEMRDLYRRDPDVFYALCRQAAEGDVTLVCYEVGDEGTVHCHRRLLKDYLIKVAGTMGLTITPPAAPRRAALL